MFKWIQFSISVSLRVVTIPLEEDILGLTRVIALAAFRRWAFTRQCLSTVQFYRVFEISIKFPVKFAIESEWDIQKTFQYCLKDAEDPKFYKRRKKMESEKVLNVSSIFGYPQISWRVWKSTQKYFFSASNRVSTSPEKLRERVPNLEDNCDAFRQIVPSVGVTKALLCRSCMLRCNFSQLLNFDLIVLSW